MSATDRTRISRALIRRDGGGCFYCKSPLRDLFHVDHKTPFVKGGADTIENMVLACVSCNQEKHNKTLVPRLASAQPASSPLLVDRKIAFLLDEIIDRSGCTKRGDNLRNPYDRCRAVFANIRPERAPAR